MLTIASVSAKPPADLQKQMDVFSKGEVGGMAVAWIDADGTVFFQTGMYSADDSRAISPDTQFEIGSVTKVFTSLLLAESERLGKVDRNNTAVKYLLPKDDPAQVSLAKITLLSLSTHTAGLPRLPSNIGLKPDAVSDPYASYDRSMLLEALRKDGQAAPVNSAMAYSNFGAAVLGEALASAWGTSYSDALHAHVLVPLGMKATTLGLAGLPPPSDLAPGHIGEKRVPNWTFQAFAPAVAMRSSARDMAVFLSACMGTRETTMRAAIDATLQPQHTADDVGGHIGLGWLMTDDPQQPVAWHNGATAGSHTFVAFCLKTRCGVAILTNFQKGSEALGFSLLGAKPPQPKVKTVVDAANFVGRYPLSPAFAIDISEVNGTLRGQATGQPSFGLHSVAVDRFAIVGIPAEISFERDSAGKITALVLHQNGIDQRAPRDELPPPRKEVILPVETVREYVGSFSVSPTFALVVTEQDGALSVQATAQSKLTVFSSAKDEFFYKAVDAQISFQRDASGKIVGLVLHQGGRDLIAKKEAD
jgi:D-alanyl-D-alanine-carboxypeptidase/D-alanyl-D-alanine-endopeptidase